MLDKFKIHHFGIIINESDIQSIEVFTKNFFVYDPIQKTRILFHFDVYKKIYNEYIVKEGRVKNLQTGYAHTCYSVNQEKYENFNNFLSESRNGFAITKLEKSITEECNLVRFYFFKNIGIIEINLTND